LSVSKFDSLFLGPMIDNIGTKWIFRNKLDESENVIRNKPRLVAQGYTQIEDIDFEKTFAPIAWSHTDDTCLCFF